MKWITDSKIAIVGLGLMGGSYARALKRLGFSVVAIDKNQGAIDFAVKNGFIDCGSVTPDAALLGEADAVIFALYPAVFKEWIAKNQSLFKSGAYITDVTGVKGSVVYDVQALLRSDVEYIAAHPMAGKEVYGVENSDDSIFKGANYIITPTEKNTKEAIKWCESLGRILGFARISVLSPEEHDEMIGFVSQLTHCIAVALMTCNDNKELVNYTGDSFRDLTRIARINENMWSELFLLNKENLIAEMDCFSKEFDSIRNMLARDDIEGLKEKMRLSTERRAYFDKPKERK